MPLRATESPRTGGSTLCGLRRVEGLKGLKIKPQGLFGVSDSFRTNVQVQGVHVRDDDLGGYLEG